MTLSTTERKIIESSIRDVKDFPKPGIIFKDITTLLNDKEAYGVLMNHLYERYKEYSLDYVAGIDARGFIFGAALAQMLGVGFVPIRKKGKLPYTTISEKYSLEYGIDEIEVHIDAFNKTKNARVLLIDDLIATGGTANAAAKLINQAGASCVEACFIIGLNFLDGQKNLKETTDVYSLIEVN
ncbi:MAG: adenine phosphoribosyltransferase [Sulfurimonas sp. RIFOXYD12_FULL_33_39]|uniref:adenine phosphoribosyltransferase n=1 Tax=unclassified Sulfurimonas TaxID=2623549 RepID=UPI0008AFAD0D|nr:MULTISPECIES: adenine phosphoribosyltransferase [unclassified Sulfurimonas]OHE07151.1 MAG: adenine phosphoribosyltransferase [Sulfurimonas sp. RIFCSPLOWO2_12_FULL_34_6]OHE09437.1 MAG: adenine phosphoribosyltransferase [Sulfurimonas sp. RIFOXYD12_FULL_33_39]OHE12781.1 MAG: adenine phosphoribosyltransferase [Sulfurimonas sp. RIFOXYD2_FULL_34_21]DAB27565.1 MAG TPA: adenine phosphoribosyltransferase [Sulfurimonas sp. UBA10385]